MKRHDRITIGNSKFRLRFDLEKFSLPCKKSQKCAKAF
jgi:hypothetical protein